MYYIGIPLSLWDGFLEICEWTLWRKDWKELCGEEWEENIGKRTGSRLRLTKFLIENREAASFFIKEILEAREILIEDENLTIDDIAQASLLRAEYFEEVPETAEFLRPKNPESLFQDRAKLIFNEDRYDISLFLPPVKKEKLPAKWSVGTLHQDAASTPDEIVLNKSAFQEYIILKLESGDQSEIQRLRGLKPWALFDLENRGRLVNFNRNVLPLRNYAIISKEKIENFTRKGFEEEENLLNEQFELSDGTKCFLTRLWPVGKFAEINLKHLDKESKIRFRRAARIEAKFFVGKRERAAWFTRLQNRLKMEGLPVLCVSIPKGYFLDDKAVLNNTFKVSMDNRKADGQWKRYTKKVDDDIDYYFWEWSEKPFMEQTKSGRFGDFQELSKCFRSPDLKGERNLSIEAREVRFREEYNIYLDHSKFGMEKCWKNLPGRFLLWFLLCQSTEGMKWDELILANDIIAPELRLSYSLLRKYADRELLLQRGRKWEIAESRAALKRSEFDKCEMKYCGDPSILWGLYRKMYYETPQLPVIEVIDKRGDVPYLQMIWDMRLQKILENYLRKEHVKIGNKLWNH